MKKTKQILTPEEIEEARNWIADCHWADLTEEDIRLLTPQEIELGIKKFFDGGIEEFRNCSR